MTYTTQPGDSLPSIAEACGHSGEWQMIAAWNPDLPDVNNIQPGMELVLPDLTTWPAPGDPEAASSSSSSSSRTRSSSSTTADKD